MTADHDPGKYFMSGHLNFRQKIRKNIPIILAVAIPMLILLILYIGRDAFPLGENVYLRSDEYHQYAPFMKLFQRILKEGGSFLYSWDIGLGTSFISTYAYYLASPVNWLVALFPEDLVPEFMNIMLIIKAGLMSGFFAYYLSKKFRRSDLTVTVFGCFYAMSSYMAAFSWNVMWLDCLLLLPLILMGLEALVKKGRGRMYAITLAISILSNYYISIMICISLVIYFIYLMICEGRFKDRYIVIRRVCQFILYSILSGCMAAVLVLPAFYTLYITASGGNSFPATLSAYYNVLELLSKSLMNTEPAIFKGHFPNLYCTVALFIFIPLYLLCRRIRAKQRAGKGILAAFFLFTFMFNIPTFIMHGFHFPNSLPCRHSFIYILFVLTMGYEALINIRAFKLKEIVIVSLSGIMAVFLFQQLYPDDITLENAALNAAFIILYLIIALLLRKCRAAKPAVCAAGSIRRRTSSLPKGAVAVALMIIAVGEIIINTNETGYSFTSRTAYTSDNEAITKLLDSIEDDSFYRAEKISRRTKNDGAWLDYKSASAFTSVAVAGVSDLYEKLGMQGQTNSFSYYGHTLWTKSILGVKYEIASQPVEDADLIQIACEDGYYLYENPYALGLGWAVDTGIKNAENLTDTPLEYQNEMVYRMCGVSDMYELLDSDYGLEPSFVCDSDGRCYVYISTRISDCSISVYRDGELIESYSYGSMENPQIIDAGDVMAGDHVYVRSEDESVSDITIYPAIMDYDKYYEAMELLSGRQMQISEYTDTYVKGSISLDEDAILFTSISYDPGWTVYVDGVKTAYTDYEDAFILVELDRGEHVIEFRYWPQGLSMGMIISLAAIALFVLCEIMADRLRRECETDPAAA